MYQYYEGVMYNLPTDVTKIVEYICPVFLILEHSYTPISNVASEMKDGLELQVLLQAFL